MNPWHLERAVRALRLGGIVLHATEGVWGLACDPFDAAAVHRVLDLKQRPVSKGLIVIGASADTFEPELAAVAPPARRQVLAAWPGPVTWILPNRTFPPWITGGRPDVAVRVPGHPQARALAAAFGGPLVSTSANAGGRPPATRAIVARRQFPGDFPQASDYILPGEVLTPGAASQIRTLSGTVLRP